jgi:glycerol-3-phosphate acyltransferase PlsY
MTIDVMIATLLRAVSYLIGGISAAYLGGKLQRGDDIR